MKFPLISHEIPKQLFSNHDFICQYPYLLCHLLSKEYHYDPEYATFYKGAVKRFGYSILDNSCFELGFPVKTDTLIEVANEYNPTHIVLPDAFRDFKGTIQLAEENLPKLIGKTNSKLFAVVQGKTLQEALDCYDFFDKVEEIDVIGINFMRFPESNNATRYDFFKLLLQTRKITKKIHFLGCENPGEFKQYKQSEMDKVFSIDTSSPIINGWKGNRFATEGLLVPKPKDKLADNLDMVLTQENIDLIAYNVNMFRNYVFDKPFN